MQPQLTQMRDDKLNELRKVVHFPEGVPAFERVKEFVIIANDEEAPFLWLQACEVPNLAFITIDPFLVYEGYRPDVREEDVEFLKIKDESDVFILAIVNIRNSDGQGITVNLVSPIVINWREKLGKQVILKNHMDYDVRYRIDAPS